MIILIDPENSFNNIQYQFMIKTHRETKIEGNFLNPIKCLYKKNLQLTW